MHNDNRLLLTEYDWEILLNKLNFPSAEEVNLAHAYFDEIENSLQISSTNNGVLVSSSQLNIDGISSAIAKRKQKKNDTILSANNNFRYSIEHHYVPSFSRQYSHALKDPISRSDIQVPPQKSDLYHFNNDISCNAA